MESDPTGRDGDPPLDPTRSGSTLDAAEVERLRADLARAVRAICPPWLSAGAEDLAHDIVVKLIERGDRPRQGIANVSAYWRKAAYHAVLDEVRRRRRDREDTLVTAADKNHRLASRGPDPEHRLLQRELGRAIEECLHSLSEARRLAAVLHLQGHTLREAATLLGWHVKKTESSLYRGLTDLRQCLRAKGIEP